MSPVGEIVSVLNPARNEGASYLGMPALDGVVVMTRNGASIDAATETWRVARAGRQDLTFPVGRLVRPPARGQENPGGGIDPERRPSMLAPDLAHAMKLRLVSLLPRHAERSVRSVLGAFLHFERWAYDVKRFERAGRPIAVTDIDEVLATAYRDHCEDPDGGVVAKGQHAYYLARFYRWALRLGYPGFTRAVARDLRGIVFEAGLRGHIANMGCPHRGAFEFEERAQIDQKLKEGAGEPADRAAVMLLWYTGLRTEAAVRLLRRHVQPPKTAGGHWWLHVPAVKQRGGTRGEVTHPKRIPAALGEALLALPPGPGEDPALFPFATKSPHDELRRALRNWADHDDVDLVTTRVRPDDPKAGWRHRGKPVLRPEMARLRLFPYRFRRTLALVLANQGADEQTIATALSDKTIAMAAVYAQNSSTMVEVLEKTLDRHPDWLRVLGIFRGTIVDIPSRRLPVIPGGAPQLAGYLEYKDIGIIGECANPSPCTLFPPLSCYRCRHFEAMPDPRVHRAQMGQIRDEIDSRVGVESDRMATIFERDLAAIIQLLAMIAARSGPHGKLTADIGATNTRRAIAVGGAGA